MRPDLGVLIQVIYSKTRHGDLKPYPRVCPRVPLHFRVHDAYPRLTLYLAECAGRSPATPPVPGVPLFTRLTRGADGRTVASSEPLTEEYTRKLLLRFLHAAHVTDANGLLDFSLHFARTTGFNDLANKLFLGRVTAAEAGGWEEGGCVAEHYQRRTAEDLACAIHRALRGACRDFGWVMGR